MTESIKNTLSRVLENISLAPYTSFNIGGKARYFLEAYTEDDIIQSLDWAKKNGINVIVNKCIFVEYF